MNKYFDWILIVIGLVSTILTALFQNMHNSIVGCIFWVIGISCVLSSIVYKLLTKDYLRNENKSKSIVKYYAILTVIAILFIISLYIYSNVYNPSLLESKNIALPLTAILIVLFGIMADKISMNSHLGLRFPWLYTSENRWNVAHKCLADISVPVSILYIIVALIVPMNYFSTISILTVLLWIAIPSVYPIVKKII